jgi:putative endonuclease
VIHKPGCTGKFRTLESSGIGGPVKGSGRKARRTTVARGGSVVEAATEASLYFVYVLHNGAGILYTGIAKDVDVRLGQHNAGSGARFTRGRGPWAICHREGPLAHGDALRREAAIKLDRTFKAALRERIAALVARARALKSVNGKKGRKTTPARPLTKARRGPVKRDSV